jgi:hypothetical protein
MIFLVTKFMYSHRRPFGLYEKKSKEEALKP